MWVCRHLGVKFFHKSWNDGEGSWPGACSQKRLFLDLGWVGFFGPTLQMCDQIEVRGWGSRF